MFRDAAPTQGELFRACAQELQERLESCHWEKEEGDAVPPPQGSRCSAQDHVLRIS